MGSKVDYEVAPDVQRRMEAMVAGLGMAHIDPARVLCVRSRGSQGNFLARIWPFERVWQLALGVPPHYVIEVKEEEFARMSQRQRDEVLIHELLHIPRTFSGSLRAHRHPGGRIDARSVRGLYVRWEKLLEEPDAVPAERRLV